MNISAKQAIFWMAIVLFLSANGLVQAEEIALDRPILVATASTLSDVEQNAVDLFVRRLRARAGLTVTICKEGDSDGAGSSDEGQYGFVLLAGVSREGNRIAKALDACKQTLPPKEESFLICIRPSWGELERRFPKIPYAALVSGRDARGLLYGLGKFLRWMTVTGGVSRIQTATFVESPAVAERGVYFASHFNNYYECAPQDELETYVEDLALWGFNTVSTWLDMAWYPVNFWDDPQSKGMQLVARIRAINEKARSLGLTVGLMAVANEAFKAQPPKELLADMSAKRGGFYPDSTLCPSKPGGMELILENRRKVMELIGPIDLYVTWPFDQGGCGCEECEPWVRTYMRISQPIREVVKEYHPQAKYVVSTWLLNDEEMEWVDAAMKEGAEWFDGVLTETKWIDCFDPPQGYSRVVFPEISMEGSLFTGYGASGANPLPRKFTEMARETANAGYGALLYSEGIYEDLNKIVWACTLWNPERTAESIVREYAQFYFDSDSEDDWAELILGLEETWPQANLPQHSVDRIETLHQLAVHLGGQTGGAEPSRVRWRYLMDRAEMDRRMARIGNDTELLRETKKVFTACGYEKDDEVLREQLRQLHDRIKQRADAVSDLFEFQWEYLVRAHLERTTALVTIPPDYIGQRDWDTLLKVLDRALAQPELESMRTEMLRGFKEWFWHGNIDLGFVFL